MRPAILAVFTLFLTACQTQQAAPGPTSLQVRPASFEQRPGWEPFNLTESNRTLYVDPSPLLTSDDIKHSRRTRDLSDRLAVNLTLIDAAGDRMYEYTRQHINEPLAIFLGDDLLTAPMLRSALRKDVMITGGLNGLTETQADAITGDQ